MARDLGFLQYVTDELLSEVPGISTKPMFSGFAVYRDGIVFALILGSTLYFKTDESTKAAFTSRGSSPFSFQKGGKEIVTAYYEVPLDILENHDLLFEWIDTAVGVSLKKKRK